MSITEVFHPYAVNKTAIFFPMAAPLFNTFKTSLPCLMSFPSVMFQQEAHQIQEERCFCIWPLMSLCKDHGCTEWILIVSTDKLYPAAHAPFEPLTTWVCSHTGTFSPVRLFLCVFLSVRKVDGKKRGKCLWRKQEGSEHAPLITGAFV